MVTKGKSTAYAMGKQTKANIRRDQKLENSTAIHAPNNTKNTPSVVSCV